MRCIWVIVVVAVAASNLAADDGIFAPGAKLKLEVEDGAGEGPAWDPDLGVLFSGEGGIGRLDREGNQTVFRPNAGSNGLLFDRHGRLLICQPGQRRVALLGRDGELEVLADRYEGGRFNTPNDITVDSHGRIYFSDPRYGSRARMEILDTDGRPVEGVYRIDSDGTLTRIITHEVDRPNGLVVTPDDRYLYVADNNNSTVGAARKLWRFDLNDDGTVDPPSRRLLFDWRSGRGPDGMVLDVQGRIYVAAGLNKANPPFETIDEFKGGVYVLSPEGKLLAFQPVGPDEVTNCTFGGDDLQTLYVTAGGHLWSIRTTTKGQLVWPRE